MRLPGESLDGILRSSPWVSEVEPHDRALRTGPFDTAKPQLVEDLLPTEERICGLPIGSSKWPAFDGGRTFAAGQVNRRTHQGVGDPLASVPGPDEEARQEPDAFVFGASPTTSDLASSAGRVPRPRTAGAPTDRLGSHESQDPHRPPAHRRQGLEAMPVATTEPTSSELAAGHAERHTPAMACRPFTLEQSGEIRQVPRPHGPSVNIWAHGRDATVMGRGIDYAIRLRVAAVVTRLRP